MRDRQPLAELAVALMAAAAMSCNTLACPIGTSEHGGRCVEDLPADAGGTGGAPNGAAANGGGAVGGIGAAASGASGTSARNRTGTGANSSGNGSDGDADPNASGRNASGNGNGDSNSNGNSSGNGNAADSSNGGSASDRSGMNGKAEPSGDPCSSEGAMRCSIAGAGNREVCVGGVWSPGDSCATGQTCVDDQGKPSCVVVEELCKGAGGQAVCDEQGSLILCDENESIAMQMDCISAKHCEAGKAMQTCALCLPDQEFKCEGVELQVCDTDGMTFRQKLECETAGLCNKMLGKCTDAVCDPGKPSCDDNSLVMCNKDGTAVESMKSCGKGTCDAKGGDCNMCEPGTKKCQDGMVATCDETGQKYETEACADNYACVGQGKCVECDGNDACSTLTKDCKVGMCSGNKCLAANAPSTTMCKTPERKDGTCKNGECICTPKCDGKNCGDDGCGKTCGPCSMTCTKQGQCVECENDNQCSYLTQGCKVGVCQGTQCKAQDAPPNTHCNGANWCQGSSCVECRGGSSGDCKNNFTCNSNHQCQCDGLVCNGQCVPGAKCCPSGSYACKDGLTCDPKSHTCGCTGGRMCGTQCVQGAECCPGGDGCTGGKTCNASNKCDCSGGRMCGTQCVQGAECCKGDSCTPKEGGDGQCDDSGHCMQICGSRCLGSLYTMCVSQSCITPATCISGQCSIECQNGSCPGEGVCNGGWCVSKNPLDGI